MTIKKPSLRDDWKKWRQFISIQAIGALTAVQTAWPMIPDDMKAHLPSGFVKWLTYILLGLAVYGIMTKQKGLEDAGKSN